MAEGAGRAGLARKTYERVQNLYNDGVVPAQKLDEATANYKAMEATALAAKAQYDMATDGARKEDKEAAAARVRQAEGAVSEVESYISDAMVYSPVTGEISTIIAEEGELVGSGYPVVAILDMSDLWVTFNVKETLLPGLRIGTRMNGYVPALDSDVEFEVPTSPRRPISQRGRRPARRAGSTSAPSPSRPRPSPRPRTCARA